MKKRIWLLYIIGLVGALVLGFVFSLFFDIDVFYKLGNGFKETSWYVYPLALIGSFYLTLAIHELTHFFAFKFKGIKGRAIYLTAFTFIKKNEKWNFNFIPKMFLLMGGLVVPDLGEMRNEEEYQKTTKNFSTSLIAAPIASIVFGSLVLLAQVLVVFLTYNYVFIGILTVFTIFIVLLTVLYTVTSLMANDMAVGDFPAYNRMKSEELFQISLICQYAQFSSALSKETEDFLWTKSNSILERQSKLYNQHTLSLLAMYLEGIVFENRNRIVSIDKMVTNLVDTSLLKTELGTNVYFNKLYYTYTQISANNALDSFIKRRDTLEKDEDLSYNFHKSLHLLGISDETEYLSDEKNLNYGKLGFIYKPLIDFHEEEQKTNKRLAPKVVDEKEAEINEE